MSTRMENIADQLLTDETWVKMSQDDRMNYLQELENQMAAIGHREPVPVTVMKAEDLVEDDGTMGYYSHRDHKIYVHPSFLTTTKVPAPGTSPYTYGGALDLIVHEGRHAWQHYVVDHPDKGLVDKKTRLSIQMNFDNYTLDDPQYGAQLIERDARAYAKAFLKELNEILEKRGAVNESIENAIIANEAQENGWMWALVFSGFSEENLEALDVVGRVVSEKRNGIDFDGCSIYGEAIAFLKDFDADSYIDSKPIQDLLGGFKETIGEAVDGKTDGKPVSETVDTGKEYKPKFM